MASEVLAIKQKNKKQAKLKSNNLKYSFSQFNYPTLEEMPWDGSISPELNLETF